MPQEIIKITNLPAPGLQALEEFVGALRNAFDTTRALSQDPLKVIVDFDNIEDVGIILIGALVETLRNVWRQPDVSWYATLSGLTEGSPIFRNVNTLIRMHKLSIACEGHGTLFCGVSKDDWTGRDDNYKDKDGTRMVRILNYLHGRKESPFANRQDVVNQCAGRNFGPTVVDRLLGRLDRIGLVVERYTPGGVQEWAHIVRYLPHKGSA